MKKMNVIRTMMAIWFMVCICLISSVYANQMITQTIAIQKGWNAICLNVKPEQPDPEIIFNNTPITQVLTYFSLRTSVQFIEDPDEVEWKKPGWRRWVTKSQYEAILNNLHELLANQAYLIFSNEDYTLSFKGIPSLPNYEWQPDSFNFVGFHVDSLAPPTFAQFFANSEAHRDFRIYDLKDNHWERIEKPDATNIIAGKAYWVYCVGGSQYQGPIEITLPGADNNLNFLNAIIETDFSIRNQSPDPISFTLETINNTSGSGFVPISLVTYSDLMIPQYSALSSYSPDDSIEAGKKVVIRLAVNPKKLVNTEVTCLLKLTDDLGDVIYIPVRAEKLIEE